MPDQVEGTEDGPQNPEETPSTLGAYDPPRKRARIESGQGEEHPNLAPSQQTESAMEEEMDDEIICIGPKEPQKKEDRKGKGKAIEIEVLDEEDDGQDQDTSTQKPDTTDMHSVANNTEADGSSRLSEYMCPICFSSPSAAVLTLCGHVMCGACLFASVQASLTRARNMGYGGDAMLAKCPVCRATLMGWDGRGGGVIGLIPKVARPV